MSEGWSRFYAAAGTDPRETLLDALARFEAEKRAPGKAVDLGCGTGRDTLELLRRGWRVVAIDSQPEAIERLRTHPEAVAAVDRLETVCAPFEDAEWPAADLVNSSFALPSVRRTCSREPGRVSSPPFGRAAGSAVSSSASTTRGRPPPR